MINKRLCACCEHRERTVCSMAAVLKRIGSRVSLVACTGLVVLMLVSVPAVANITASSANDVCAASADPCVVSAEVDIVGGSTLDFGARSLVVQGSGSLNFGAGAAAVLCGDLTTLSWSYPRIVVRGVVTEGFTGGEALIVSRGSCSSDSTIPCMSDDDCQAAGAGTCSSGTGNITLNGETLGWANPGGTVHFVAHGKFSSTKDITMSCGNYAADGGVIGIVTNTGSITTGDLITVRGDLSAVGGTVEISAATTLTINAEINAVGGSGGVVNLHSGSDTTVNAPINAYANYSDGVGGTVALNAGGNITVGSSRSINTTGHRSSSGSEGSGEDQQYTAGGSITIGNNAQLLASAPDSTLPASGGQIELNACAVTVNGGAVVQAKGMYGGSIQLAGGDSVIVSNTASIDASGSNGQDVILTTQVTDTNPNTYGTQTQFAPGVLIEQTTGLPACP